MSVHRARRINALAWIAGIVVLGALAMENLRGNVSLTGGIHHGWPAVFMTRANFREANANHPPRGTESPRWETSSVWPVDGARVKRFWPASLLVNLLLAAILIALTMMKIQLWGMRSRIRVRLSLKVLLTFPAICATGYLLWGSELDAWLRALGKISFTVVAAAIAVSWLAIFDVLSLVIYVVTKRAVDA